MDERLPANDATLIEDLPKRTREPRVDPTLVATVRLEHLGRGQRRDGMDEE